jgi:MFS family permease
MTTQLASSAGSQGSSASETSANRAYVIAWACALVFYFIQYALRSAPGVMIPELTAAFGLTALGISSVIGLYYYSYAGLSIVAGAALDRYGGKLPISAGVFAIAIGSILFGLGSVGAAETGRLLQGAGSGFAFTGAVFLAAHGFAERRLATAIGFTQFAGMLGGSAGQFVVGPLVHGPIPWQAFWIYAGMALAIVGILMLVVTPGDHKPVRTGVWSMFGA